MPRPGLGHKMKVLIALAGVVTEGRFVRGFLESWNTGVYVPREVSRVGNRLQRGGLWFCEECIEYLLFPANQISSLASYIIYSEQFNICSD